MPFDPSTAKIFDPSTAEPVEKKKEPSFLEALMPLSSKQQITKGSTWSPGAYINASLSNLADIATIPVRAIGATRQALTTPKSFKQAMAEPEQSLFRPEMNKIEQNLPKQGIVGGLAKGTVETLGGLLGDPAAMIPLAKAGNALVQGSNKLLGKTVAGLSGVSSDALRAYGTGFGKTAKAIRYAALNKEKIANEWLDKVENFERFLPEDHIINESLRNMPKMDFRNVIKAIDKAKVKELSEPAKNANNHLEKLKQIYMDYSKQTSSYEPIRENVGKIPASSKKASLPINLKDIGSKHPIGFAKVTETVPIPASDFREARMQLDNAIKSVYAKDKGAATIFEKQGIAVRAEMKKALEESAVRSGYPEYVDAMKNYSDKLTSLEKIKGYLGYDAETRERRVQSFIANLQNKNKENARNIMTEIDKIMGTDIGNQSKMLKYASEFGDEGKPGLLPQHTTGKAMLGPYALGGGAGAMSSHPILGAIGLGSAALSSPKLAAPALSTAQKGADLVDILNRMAIKGAKYTKGIPGLSSASQNIMNR